VIRRLRRRHLVLGVAVLATAPVLLALAVGVRPAEPRNATLPGLSGGAPSIRLAGLPVEFRLDPAAGAFAFRATGPLMVPDPLLYWSATAPVDASLPRQALLLGSLSTERFSPARVPQAALTPGGVFMIWDGGHGRLVATVQADFPLEGRSTP
jgi:hypothetical protein